MNTLGIFSAYSDAWAAVLAGATDRLMPIAMSFCYFMSVFAIVLVLFGSMTRGGTGVISMGCRWLLVSIGYIIAIQHAQGFAETLLEGVVSYGLTAGGVNGDASDFLSSPDAVMQVGIAKFADINELTASLCTGWSGCIGAIHVAGPMFLASAGVLVSYWIAAFAIMSAAMLTHLGLLASMLVLPFAIFAPISSIGSGPIRFAFTCGVQIFVLVLVISVNTAVFSQITIGESPGWSAAMGTIIASFLFVGMLLGASRLAYSLTSSATLGAGALFGAPVGMAAAAGRNAVGRVISTTPTGVTADTAISAGSGARSAAANVVMPQTAQTTARQTANAARP